MGVVDLNLPLWPIVPILCMYALSEVNAAVTKESTISLNSIKEIIRDEMSAGVQKQVKSFFSEMEELKERERASQFNELLMDLKETVSMFDKVKDTSSGPSIAPYKPSTDGQSTRSTSKLFRPEELHASCAELQASGVRENGAYIVYPRNLPLVKVYCDFTTLGGGWTVFQRRVNGSVDFYRDWLEYVTGFGDVGGEFWLGLRNLHVMTHAGLMELYIHLEDFDNNSRYARYTHFAVSSDFTDFRLDLGSYYGDAGDGMSHSRGHRFSTKDMDHDNHPNDHCATRFTGGWWYNSCYRANLNGQYQIEAAMTHQGITWVHWRGDSYSLKTTTLMFRPVDFITHN